MTPMILNIIGGVSSGYNRIYRTFCSTRPRAQLKVPERGLNITGLYQSDGIEFKISIEETVIHWISNESNGVLVKNEA